MNAKDKRLHLLSQMTIEAEQFPRDQIGAEEHLLRYCVSILAGEITACRKIRLLCAVLLDKLLHPEKYAPWVFDREQANRHIAFIEIFCRQPQGGFGQPIQLELFQKARLQALFGFVHAETGLRQYNEVLIIEGRKNGKTTECACVELDLLVNDGESAPEIYNIATKRDQAKKGFTACVQIINQSPDLQIIRKRQSDLYFPFNMGTISVLASAANSLDGLNSHAVILDELAAIKNRAVYDDMKQSMSARAQPVLFCITTNGFIREGIYDRQYEYAASVLDGSVDDEHFLAWIYELDAREEYLDEAMWIKANPGLDTIKSRPFLRQMVERAKADPSFLPTVLTKDFNWTENTATAWLNWAEISNPEICKVRFDYCIGGFDAADSIDLFAATALCMRPGDPKIYRRSMYWIPQSVLDEDARAGNRRGRDSMPYELWVRRGLMRAVPGNKIDKQVALDWFIELRDVEDLYVMYIGYDPWHIDDSLLAKFRAEFGEQSMIPIRQGVYTLSQPMKDLKAELGAGHVVDNNNPIDKMCLMNTEIRTDINGNIQPVKSTDPRRRIDGTIALICAYKVLQDKRNDYIDRNEEA